MDFSDEVKEKLKRYSVSDLIFTKKNHQEILQKRRISGEEIIRDITNPEKLVFAQKQIRVFKGIEETRYRCYFVHSHSKGRCYVLKFNLRLKIITVFPLGRKTLNRYRKRFK